MSCPLSEDILRRCLMYCKLWELREDEEVAALVPFFMEAARDYLARSGIMEPMAGEEGSSWELLLDRLVLAAWEHRAAIQAEEMKPNPYFDRALDQLRMSSPLFSF